VKPCWRAWVAVSLNLDGPEDLAHEVAVQIGLQRTSRSGQQNLRQSTTPMYSWLPLSQLVSFRRNSLSVERREETLASDQLHGSPYTFPPAKTSTVARSRAFQEGCPITLRHTPPERMSFGL
jgi:hypothetical protein